MKETLSQAIVFLPPRYRPYFLPAALWSLGVIVAVLAAYTAYQTRIEGRNARASAAIHAITSAIEDGAGIGLDQLYVDFAADAGDGHYPFGAMPYAKWLFEEGRYEEAGNVYRRVIERGDDPYVRDLARLGMINVMFELEEGTDTIDQIALQYESANVYSQLALDYLLGDVYAAKGAYEEAVSYYEQALNMANNLGDQNFANNINYKISAMFSARLQQGGQ
ncbi:MAG: tetratricopeptide repeat protein [Betaproteobacteria bacterium AqS2]|uniref:Tetratricopeptide repeat protein n=1 Tax=Candidatus Amphirhobacter heronislandensis TaxID=1732024 RepID=A0A930UEK3_9GAMM|nr:tetratricopeptide repeat protein [Betaproteobacteria bacterium AqS2]